MSALERLLDLALPEPNSGCWLWLGSLDTPGYGQFWMNGSGIGAHRAAYLLLKGAIPEGLQLDHTCRVRCCVNPQHLEPVTCLINIQRGETGKRNREKTHCKNGHLFTERDTIWSKGTRSCRVCRNLAQLRCSAKKKAARRNALTP